MNSSPISNPEITQIMVTKEYIVPGSRKPKVVHLLKLVKIVVCFLSSVHSKFTHVSPDQHRSNNKHACQSCISLTSEHMLGFPKEMRLMKN